MTLTAFVVLVVALAQPDQSVTRTFPGGSITFIKSPGFYYRNEPFVTALVSCGGSSWYASLPHTASDVLRVIESTEGASCGL